MGGEDWWLGGCPCLPSRKVGNKMTYHSSDKTMKKPKEEIRTQLKKIGKAQAEIEEKGSLGRT